MAIYTEWVRFGPESIPGYLCFPERARRPLPAVLVIQEAWGVDGHIEDVARRVAAAGYASFAPDLYAQPANGARPEPLTRERMAELLGFLNALPPAVWSDPAAREAELARLPEPARSRIGESYAAIFGAPGTPGVIQAASHLPRLQAAARFLRADCDATRGQKVASVGFCMGGGLSALLACHDAELAGAIVFYGSAPPLELVPQIRCPVLGFYGALDARINAGIAPFADAMTRAGKRFEHHVFEGAGHAFFNDGRPSYEVRAARAAFTRALEFFAGALR